jgi:D-serine deaminase-like pyridoxal phosphate-dependent protein
VLTETEKQKLDKCIGKTVDEIETPALLVDLDIMERNMDKIMEFLSQGTVGLRPHAKTHKTAPIARMQIEKGAVGITCATVGEAEVLVDGGIKDVLITNRVVSKNKIERAAILAKKADLIVAIDCEENLADISSLAVPHGVKIGIIVEVDTNNGRAGVRTIEEAISLAKLASELPGVAYRGIMGYEGHCVFIPSLEERRKVSVQSYDRLFEYKRALSDAGFEPEIVSSSGTGTYPIAGRHEGITDIQPGSYIFMDARYADIEGVDFEQSLTVLSTIVSNPEQGVYICDAGIKSMSEEFGLVLALPSYGLKVKGMSEEYITLLADDSKAETKPYLGAIDRMYGQQVQQLGVGSRIHLVPSHCCTTVNLHDVIYATRNGKVQNVWRVAGRGRFA